MDEMTEMRLMLVELKSGVGHLVARLDDARVIRDQQHQENVQRLASIEREVRTTNGRVTKAEKDIETLKRDAPRGVVTKTTAKEFASFAGWVAAGILALMKMTGKL